MQSIGERLEEARKRKGISLREAAEATKIRSDFLGYIEQNKMDFSLPEIYKRGFLKNYARYLKLDYDKIMTDYNAQELSKSRLGKKAGSEWFGQMEVKKNEGDGLIDHLELEESTSYGRILAKPAPAEEAETNEDGDGVFWPYMRDENLARDWALPGTPDLMHRIGGIEKEDGTGNISYDPENHGYMVDLRQERVQKVKVPDLEVDGSQDYELLVVGWGSRWRK